MKVIIIFFLIFINKIVLESKKFKFVLTNSGDFIVKNLKIEENSTFILRKNIPFIGSLIINFVNSSNITNISNLYSTTLISTTINSSVLLSNVTCEETKDNITINNSEFKFKACGPYSASLTQKQETTTVDMVDNIYLSKEVYISACSLEYDAIISLQNLNNYGMVILNYEQQFLELLAVNDTELINERTSNMKKCRHSTGKKFAFRIDYILFGHEDESDDAFLAKNVSGIAYLDNLSAYSVFPYEYLNYFMTSFFSELNDECEKRQYKDSNFYFISCKKEKIAIHTIKRTLNLIIDNFSYSLTNLFNNTFSLIDEYKPELIYFNILFLKDSNFFVLGVDFFSGKEIAYSFIDNNTYLYFNESIDFTNDFSSNKSYFKIILYSFAGIAFSGLLILCTIYNCVFTKRITREFGEMQREMIS